MAATYRKAVDDDIDWQQRLANYASNKDAGKSEYDRAMEIFRGKSAAGDTAGAEAAKKWSDQVNTAIGGIGNNRGAQMNNALDTVGQKVNAKPFEFKQAAAPFNYDAQSDPSYQAMLKTAQANIQSSQNNTLANLAARGQGNSSYATTVAQQIANKEMGNVSNNLLPQLMQQAYARYQDQVNNDYRNQLANYQSGQDQIGNLSKYAGTLSDLGQRDLDNQYRDNALAETKKQNNYDAYLKSVGLTGDLGTGAKDDYSLLGSRSGNLSLQGQQLKDNQTQQAFDNKLKQQQMQQSAQQFAASQGIQWANLNQRQQEFVAEQAMKLQQLNMQNDPKSLDNQYKQAQINSLNAKNPQSSGIDEYDLALVDSMANQQGVDFGKPESVKSFVADLKGKYGWTTDEAKAVEGHLSKGGQSSGSSGSWMDFLPSFSLDSIGNNAQGGADFLKSIPGGFEGYGDYLKETLKSLNPLNAFKSN